MNPGTLQSDPSKPRPGWRWTKWDGQAGDMLDVVRGVRDLHIMAGAKPVEVWLGLLEWSLWFAWECFDSTYRPRGSYAPYGEGLLCGMIVMKAKSPRGVWVTGP